MTRPSTLDRARESFARQSWAAACEGFAAAERESPLEACDLELQAAAADLAGRNSAELWTRAHHGFQQRKEMVAAARCAIWLGFALMNRGERAPAAGWFARARRLLDESAADCVERGYLLLPQAMLHIVAGDNAGAMSTFEEAAAIGSRFGDASLIAIARNGRGRALIRLGRVGEGVALLDEVMVGITAGELSPFAIGDVYCSMIEACHEIFDMRRAQEWTAALSQWIASQPELVPYRGQCLIRRAEILQLHGAWPDALEESLRACDELTRPPPQRAAGAAFYQQAELHRLRGEFGQAEIGYREASERGRRPEPGLALLRLAQGQVGVAAAAIRRALDEARDRLARSRLLAAHAEIMLAAGDLHAARNAADELAGIARGLDVPFMSAIAAGAVGAVLFAEGDARAALAELRRAWLTWHEMEAPYEAARTRVLISLACKALGDVDSAGLELDAARRTFEQLGAARDVARIDALLEKPPASAARGLTARELQVLRLIATGKTNRAIAADLFISDKTVARHVSNIFMKLGLPSRAAATAFAYEHHLV
jgi:DNA-binding CsgD family transcriptional regulator